MTGLIGFWQDWSTTTDTFVASVMGHDGSVVLAGVTAGPWRGSHAGGAFDFAAVKLDSSGDEVWRWQVWWIGGIYPFGGVGPRKG